ncbi:MAG: hypothetical protein KIS87_04625 [Phycisphaeraceae bacterium]|nr:hypothetical protein [Phycisphaeraceae bacterium]
MPGRRHSPPLFELLQGSQPAGVRHTAPEPRPAPAPRPISEPRRADPQPSPRPKPTPTPEPPRDQPHQAFSLTGGEVRVPTSYALVALAAVLGLIIGAWTIGFRSGESSARDEALRRELAIQGPATDPTLSPTTQRQTDTPRQQPRQSDTPTTQRQTPGGAAAVLGPTGVSSSDPRQPQTNYLRLATLPQDDAVSAIAFLNDRGFQAFAVIDPRTRSGNNPPRYALYAAAGFPSDGFRASEAERARLRSEALRLGQAWRAAGGVSNFADAGWERADR